MKTGLGALGTAENESWSAKHENDNGHAKRDPTHSLPPKMSPGAQNLKTGPDAHGTTENESGSANMKTSSDALGTAENESGSAKQENGTRRPRYRRKRVRERKT
jgi:hypothetical protein